ncbi:hypothetical protein CkaCkLH20_09089 [Colletotrichum karsti]|uniref:Uncharacterized protein n=1 Tax=Colletotrichum karsti TaxID=1095194 RepID=A0A9P6I3F3_9PEZI|nr:uncharacterized protein CkaCkLH20_09089 [Colletotrichum karsti]KAF9873276.1 hypothetical protein CkaCkLH20_09089 [Colletotrichum karsti]
MIRLEFEPHELNLIKQGLCQTGFAYLDPDNIIDQEHWILFKSLELHPDERPFRTRKLIVAVRITAIIRAAVTIACQNGMGPTAVTKLGFWKLVRAQLQDDKTFNSASNEELLAWKHMVEVYHAAWIRNAEQDPTSIRSHVATPHSNSPNSYTL